MKFEYAKGATPIDADEAAELIPNLTIQNELNEWEQQNILTASVKHYGKKYTFEKILDIFFLKSIHKDMFDNTWKWAGEFRKTLKNLGVEPSQIYIELKSMLDDVVYWINNNTYSKDEICVIFHHRLVSIHLFANGNGRHARFAADLLTESLDIEPFTWGNKDLYKEGEDRKAYIGALKEADKNNYKLLLKFVRT